MTPPIPLVDLDRAATAPLCDAALAAMEPFLVGVGPTAPVHGNPSGSHAIARVAVRALDEAREVVAACLGCRPDEVVFTSGGTEADNQAVTGGMPPRDGVVICSAVEHDAVLEPTLALGGTVVGVDRVGRVDLDRLAEALRGAADRGGPAVVSVMLANNELGTINDLAGVAELVLAAAAAGAGAPVLHTDAVQAAAWLDLPSLAAPADLVSVSAHKLGGPKGVGALVVRRSARAGLRPLLRGGSQERGLRAGTPDLAGIVGFAAALASSVAAREERCAVVAARRDHLAAELGSVHGVCETVGPEVAASLGMPADRSHVLPGHLHLLVDGVGSEELLLLMEQAGVCASAGSSCASGAVTGSHVLDAIGADVGPHRAPLRLSLGADTSDADVERVATAFVWSVEHIRSAPRRERLVRTEGGVRR